MSSITLSKFGTGNLEPGTWNLESGIWNLDLGSWILVSGSQACILKTMSAFSAGNQIYLISGPRLGLVFSYYQPSSLCIDNEAHILTVPTIQKLNGCISSQSSLIENLQDCISSQSSLIENLKRCISSQPLLFESRKAAYHHSPQYQEAERLHIMDTGYPRTNLRRRRSPLRDLGIALLVHILDARRHHASTNPSSDPGCRVGTVMPTLKRSTSPHPSSCLPLTSGLAPLISQTLWLFILGLALRCSWR